MEQKKAKVVEQLKLMQSAAQANLDAGGDFYAMHATCAVEFAKNALELLESVPEQEHVEQAREKENARRFAVEVKDRKSGKVERYEYDGYTILGIKGESGETVRHIKGAENLLKIYLLAKRQVKRIEEQEPLIAFLTRFGEINGDVLIEECD